MGGHVSRRSFLLGLALTAGLSSVEEVGSQGAYPARPVRVIVPFGAGGVADITIRIVSEKLGEKLALPPFLEPRRKEIEAGLKPL